jgi:hypothetical protein
MNLDQWFHRALKKTKWHEDEKIKMYEHHLFFRSLLTNFSLNSKSTFISNIAKNFINIELQKNTHVSFPLYIPHILYNHVYVYNYYLCYYYYYYNYYYYYYYFYYSYYYYYYHIYLYDFIDYYSFTVTQNGQSDIKCCDNIIMLGSALGQALPSSTTHSSNYADK